MAKQLNDWMAAQPLERQSKILAKADQIQASIRLAELRAHRRGDFKQYGQLACCRHSSPHLPNPPLSWLGCPDQMQFLSLSLQLPLPNGSDQLG